MQGGWPSAVKILIREWHDSRLICFMQQLITLTIITTVCLLPALAILVLNSINTTNKRIYTTIAFTGGLAILLRLLTNANLKEVFAVTLGFVHTPTIDVNMLCSRKLQICRHRSSFHWERGNES